MNRVTIINWSLGKRLLLLAAPLLAQNAVNIIQPIVDLFWLGRVSDDAVAAVGFVGPLSGVLFALTMSIPFIGTQVIVSQQVGAGNRSNAEIAAFCGLIIAATFGILGSILAYLATEPVIYALATIQSVGSNTVAELATTYFIFTLIGVPFAAMSDAMEGAFIGQGDSQSSFYINFFTVLGNVVLDPILIFGLGPIPELGIRGAALATVGGYATGAILGACLNSRSSGEKIISSNTARIKKEFVRDIIIVGYPRAIENATRQALRVVVTVVIFTIGGAIGLVIYIVGSRATSIASVPAHGIQQAVQTIVGQKIGADDQTQAKQATRLGLLFAVSLLLLIGIIQFSFPESFVNIFVPSLNQDNTIFAANCLQILSVGYPAIGALYVFQASFNAARHTKVSLVSTIFQNWIIQLPLIILGSLILDLGIVFVFYAIAFSDIIVAIGLYLFYKKCTRNKMYEAASDVAHE